MKIRLWDFDYMTPEEFNQALAGFLRSEGKRLDNELWQTRFLSSVIASFSMKTRKAVEPKKFFLLPGEKMKNRAKAVSRDLKQMHGAAVELMRKLNSDKNERSSAD